MWVLTISVGYVLFIHNYRSLKSHTNIQKFNSIHPIVNICLVCTAGLMRIQTGRKEN